MPFADALGVMAEHARERRMLLAAAVNQIGNTLTIVAVFLSLQEEHGLTGIGYNLAIQMIPPLLIRPSWTSKWKGNRKRTWIAALLLLLAVNVLNLCLGFELWRVYSYTVIASLLNAVLNPVVSAFQASAISPERMQNFLTRSGALRVSSWVVGPLLAALAQEKFGREVVFFADAATFVAAAATYLTVSAGERQPEAEQRFSRRIHLLELLSMQWLPRSAIPGLLVWHLLTIVSTFLNLTEFALFERLALTRTEIGICLSAWGAGGLVCFLFSLANGFVLSSRAVLTVFALATVLFPLARGVVSVGFSLALQGMCMAWLGGYLRARMQRRLGASSGAVSTWVLIQQQSIILSAVLYAALSVAVQMTERTFLLEVAYPVSAGVLLWAVRKVERHAEVPAQG